jgi:hypothetical protein
MPALSRRDPSSSSFALTSGAERFDTARKQPNGQDPPTFVQSLALEQLWRAATKARISSFASHVARERARSSAETPGVSSSRAQALRVVPGLGGMADEEAGGAGEGSAVSDADGGGADAESDARGADAACDAGGAGAASDTGAGVPTREQSTNTGAPAAMMNRAHPGRVERNEFRDTRSLGECRTTGPRCRRSRTRLARPDSCSRARWSSTRPRCRWTRGIPHAGSHRSTSNLHHPPRPVPLAEPSLLRRFRLRLGPCRPRTCSHLHHHLGLHRARRRHSARCRLRLLCRSCLRVPQVSRPRRPLRSTRRRRRRYSPQYPRDRRHQPRPRCCLSHSPPHYRPLPHHRHRRSRPRKTLPLGPRRRPPR